jgi:hypothetical protein
LVELSGGGDEDVLDRGRRLNSSSIEGQHGQIRVIARARLSETPPTRVPHPWRTRNETCASAAGRRSPAAVSDDNLPLLAETNTSNGAKSAPANTSTRANSRTPSPRWARNLAKHPELKPSPHLLLLGTMRVLDGDPDAPEWSFLFMFSSTSPMIEELRFV